MAKEIKKLNTYIKVCLKCGETFTCNNKSRKFCPHKNCKDCYHNDIKLVIYHRNKESIKGNESNFAILDSFYNAGYRKISRHALTQSRFEFDRYSKVDLKEGLIAGTIYHYAGGYDLKILDKEFFEIIFTKSE